MPTAHKKTDTLHCEPGVIRLFGTADIDSHGLKKGWSSPESSHVWNDGLVSELVLDVPNTRELRTLIIEGRAHVSTLQPYQDLTIYANGYFVGYWRVTDGEESTKIEANILPAFWLQRDDKLLLTLSFVMPFSTRPSEIGAPGDHRQLAFAFQSILLSA